jgi:protein TonB
MFTNLLASGPKRRVISSPAWTISAGAHVLVVAVVLWETTRPPAQEASTPVQEWVAYVEITEETPPPPDEPEPPAEKPASAEPVEVTTPDLPAGFQVLATPIEMAGIPAPGLVEFKAEDFSGMGVAGGVAGGRPLVAMTSGPPADSVPEDAPLSVAVVDEPPRLLNRAEIGPEMEQLYPPSFRLAEIEGEVVVWFVVDAQGRVEADDLRIVRETQAGFASATRTLVRRMRFEPARRNGRPVRVWVEQPLRWTVAR